MVKAWIPSAYRPGFHWNFTTHQILKFPNSYQLSKIENPPPPFSYTYKVFYHSRHVKKCKFKFEIAKLWREFQQRQRNIRKSPQRKSEKRRFSFYVFADGKNWALLTMYFWKISKKKFGRKHFLANQTHRSFGSHHFAPLCKKSEKKQAGCWLDLLDDEN